ncbi:MAG: DNA repair protein RecN [Proteobacteria bacterium]|nr:DNA repair protein RecN [Pseudomonadota bacterium]
MLASLTIHNIVLIDRLTLEGNAGLSALTGETGAGKSILLDALGLALGGRAEAGLVRHGESQASVTACFDIPARHPVLQFLKAGIDGEMAMLREAWDDWRSSCEKLEQAAADIEAARQQEEYLKYAVAELGELDPQVGEEKILAEKRIVLLNREKMQGAFEQAAEILESERGIQALLGKLQTLLDKSGIKTTEVTETLGRAKNEIDELSYQVERLKNGDVGGDDSLEDIEERYFSLKECAKKHRCTSDDLPRIHAELSQKLRLITHQEDALSELTQSVAATRKNFMERAEKVSVKRQKATQKLSKAVNAEFPDLRLDKARFAVDCSKSSAESDWSPWGFDVVRFVVSTNPQTPAGPIHKIASGGELSRFMLALKLILAETSSIPTLIFDEVDSGIGGATADAVGERLARLSRNYQVLVVTHSPQVAARAAHHWIVAKTEQKGTVITKITALQVMQERQEEIARMLSGAKITVEARAAAAKLLESHAA